MLQSAVLVLLLGTVTAWFLMVPRVLSPSSFFASVGVLAGCLWVTSVTWMNARPANSLAQSLHDADLADARKRRRS